jgi:hypothetical protein
VGRRVRHRACDLGACPVHRYVTHCSRICSGEPDGAAAPNTS